METAFKGNTTPMVEDNEDGTHVPLVKVINGGGSGSTTDRELVVSTYRCRTAFTGASVGDTITATQVIDVSGASPSTVSTIWRNQTTASDLASAPSAANLELTGSTALTSAQLTAAGLALDVTAQATNTSLGTDGATPPTIAGTGVRGWLRGIFERLSAFSLGGGNVDAGTQRVTLAADGPGVGQLTSISTAQTISVGATQVVAIGAASTQSAAVGAGRNRVVLIPTVDCWIALGANPTAAKAAGSFFLAAGSQSYPINVTPGTTKIAVLTDASGVTGSLSVIESV